MLKCLLAGFFSLLLVSCSGINTSQKSSDLESSKTPENECPANVPSEEYVVYSTVIESFQRPKFTNHFLDFLVILNHTENNSDKYPLSESLNKSDFLSVKESLTFSDFQEKNSHPLQLTRDLNLNSDYAFFSDKDLQSLYRNAGGTVSGVNKALQRKFPDADGIIKLSRVGFNQDLTKALIYTEFIECGTGCGDGNLLLLIKKDCRWTIEKKLLLWSS